MEKQGMGRRKRSFRIGLLIERRDKGTKGLGIRDKGAFGLNWALGLFMGFFVICAVAGLWADEDEIEEFEYEPIEVRLETNPVNPIVNNPWSVIILVNHPRPDEVNVNTPDFSSSLALESIRTDTRTISGSNSRSERWTRVEFLFTPRRPETFTLDPFEVTIHNRLALTDRINIRIQSQTAARYEPRFRWLAPPSGLRLGETAEIILELTNWDPSSRIPEDLFRGRTPLNAIIEENPPERTTAGGYRYRIIIIPLEAGRVRLESFAFHSDSYTLSVPEISLIVLPALLNQAASNETNSDPRNDIPINEISGIALSSEYNSDVYSAAFPFPETGEEVSFLLRREYLKIIAGVEALWNENLRAEALAELRKNERDSPAGPFLVSLRRQLEEALGITVTEDERWRPLGISLFSFVFFFIVLVFSSSLLFALRLRLRDNHVTFIRRYGFIIIPLFILIIGLVFVIVDGNQGFFPLSGSVGRIAVLKGTQSYRVPDYKGAVNDWFSEGQPATVGDFRGEWCFAETPDGRSGWVERGSVINY